MFMGGEYLPPVKKGEVEIARISLESVSGDQISVRARRSGGRISYSIVDEYGNYYMDTTYARAHPARRCRWANWRQCWTVPRRWRCRHEPAVALINIGESRDELRCFVSVESISTPNSAGITRRGSTNALLRSPTRRGRRRRE